ncbi:LPXTG cell wall anchor domain-containing protein [Streptococcus gallolyticus]|uniref:LPXTG cell wall anchor domain-containing protein n=1 Tax=Streptococcus gallolyticus TaxID=315405 RepID=UPI0015A3F496
MNSELSVTRQNPKKELPKTGERFQGYAVVGIFLSLLAMVGLINLKENDSKKC